MTTSQSQGHHLVLPLGILLANLVVGPSALAQPSPATPAITEADVLPVNNPVSPVSISPQLQLNYGRSGPESTGFTGLAGFLPLWQDAEAALTFLSGTIGAASANDAIAALHLGHRRQIGNILIGGYGGIDLRSTPYQTIPQLGVGLEVIGDTWDIHLNGYLPLGQARSQISSTATASNPRFVGNQLLIDRHEVIQSEVALGGLDLEASVRLATFGDSESSLWGHAGLFYASGPGIIGRWGGRLGLDYHLPHHLRVGIGVTQNFQGQGQVALSLQLPITLAGREDRPQTHPPMDALLWQRAAEPLVRQTGGWLTISHENRLASGLVAINPETGTAYQFRHVDPIQGTGTSPAATREAPYDTVANAIGGATAGDIIYVQSGHAGDGFTIPAGVAVRSSGPTQRLNTQFGTVSLPDSGSGVLPTISGTVTLSNHTVLSGLAITPPIGQVGVLGNTVNTVHIEHNQIATRGTNAGGIRLTGASGSLTLTGNHISTTGDSTAFPNGAQGIQVHWAGATDSVLSMTHNTIATTGNHADGIDLQADDDAVVTAVIVHNWITQTGGDGIEIDANDNARLILNISQNQIAHTGDRDDGIMLDLNDQAQAAIAISHNTLMHIGGAIANTAGEAIEIDTAADTQATLIIAHNQIDSTSGDGIFLNLDDRSQVTAMLDQNTIQNTDDEAIHVDAEDANTRLMLTLTGNQISWVNDDGIFMDIDDGAHVTTMLRSNVVTHAAQDSFDIDHNSHQPLCLMLADNRSAIATDNDFELDANNSLFQIVNLSAVTDRNTGHFVFEPSIANFTAVAGCS